MNNILSYGKSDPGVVRQNNEDSFLVISEFRLDVLADGMGGAAGGELASRIFTETALELFSTIAPDSEIDSLRYLHTAYELANARILDHARSNPVYTGMGCTAEVLHLLKDRFVIGHVGDSRTYLYRKESLTQLTRDHSLVQDQLDRGHITAEEARRHNLRHIILRSVGVTEDLKVDIIKGDILPGDLFLICSDGLTDMVDDDRVREILSMPIDIRQKVGRLIESAKSAGGFDNITVILSQVDD